MYKPKDYIIEFNKLRDGLNTYDFEVNSDFVDALSGQSKQSQIQGNAHLIVNKRPSLFELSLRLNVILHEVCDRCLTDIEVPLVNEASLIIKLSDFEKYDDDEIIYVTHETIHYDVSQFIYDTLILGLPIQITCEFAGLVCAQSTREITDVSENITSPEDIDPRWEKLKDIFKKK